MLTNVRPSDKNPEKSREPDLLIRLHNSACILCTLHAARCLLMCILTALNAWQDVCKFEGIRASRPFHYYLTDNNFGEYMGIFLWVSAELILYIALCRRAEQKKSSWGSIVYFLCMLVFHIIVWLKAHYLIPGYPLQFPNEDELVFFYRFAEVTILPAVVYFALYLFRVHKLSKSTS